MRDEKIHALSEVPAFRALSAKELVDLGRLVDVVSIPSGLALTTEATAGYEAFVVLAGSAAVTIGGDVVATVGRGDVVGEQALLDHGPRTATVVALEPMEVAVFGPREFATLLATFPAVASHVLRSLSGRLRSADAALVDSV